MPPENAEPTLPPRRVLVIEDEPTQRRLLLQALPDMGFEVRAAASAEDGQRLLETDDFAIALVDLNLPGQDGLSFFETARQTHPHLQVIIVTGYGDLEAARKAIRLDVVDFLKKPCPLGEMEVALDRAWRRIADRVNASPSLPTSPPNTFEEPIRIEQAERQLVFAALERHNHNRTAAARELGISVRTLYNRLARYEAEDQLGTRLKN